MVSGEITLLKISCNCPGVLRKMKGVGTVSLLMRGSASNPDLHLFLWENLQATLS